MTASRKDAFVLDGCDGSLVVMPLGEARRLAELNDALDRSRTWAEFLVAVADDAETTAYLAEEYDGELPEPDEPFDPDEIPGFPDGVWPTWPQRAMLDWLPPSVLRLGTLKDSLTSGLFVHLPEQLEDEVIEALEAEGIEWRFDSGDLVERACGGERLGDS